MGAVNLFDRWHFLHRAWRYRLRTERDELRYVLAQDLAGLTAVDAGANRGVYSYWMHRRAGARGGRVVAFEPQPELARDLHAMKQAFHLDQLTVVCAGLSSHLGTSQLIRPKNHWG